MQRFLLYLKLIKFSHTIFAMPFALLGTFIAYQHSPQAFSLKKLIWIILCMIFARTSAMSFNRYLDRDIDKLNPRTQNREIPSNKIKPIEALTLSIVSAVLFSFFAYLLNPLCFYLSPLALLVILGYSYTKRFTWLCHLILGVGLALAPIGAYLAITGQFHLSVILIGLSVMFWVSGFDIIYALQDESFDKTYHLYSIPSIFGKERAIYTARFLHLTSSLILLFVFYHFHFGWLFFTGWLIFTAFLLYEHYLVTPKDTSKIPFAFGVLNGWAGLIFGLFGILDMLIQ
ncbi:MAG: 4-hydroxybenzoate octaprenyltransferase [Bacteroidetes bacterium]|nr:MAG: 4-hydroxybenzoate octaprenyltransferase [Bacteroidota bacterium]